MRQDVAQRHGVHASVLHGSRKEQLSKVSVAKKTRKHSADVAGASWQITIITKRESADSGHDRRNRGRQHGSRVPRRPATHGARYAGRWTIAHGADGFASGSRICLAAG